MRLLSVIIRCIYTDIMAICDIHNRYSSLSRINVTSIRGDDSRTESLGILLDRKRLLHKYVYEDKNRDIRERKRISATSKHRCRVRRSFLTKTGRTHRSLSYWNRANEAATRSLATHTGACLRESALRTVRTSRTRPRPTIAGRRMNPNEWAVRAEVAYVTRDAACALRATISCLSTLGWLGCRLLIRRVLTKDIHRAF